MSNNIFLQINSLPTNLKWEILQYISHPNADIVRKLIKERKPYNNAIFHKYCFERSIEYCEHCHKEYESCRCLDDDIHEVLNDPIYRRVVYMAIDLFQRLIN